MLQRLEGHDGGGLSLGACLAMTMQADEGRSYPAPVLPSHPVLRFGELCRDEAIEPSILDVGTHVFTTSGRAAIAHALQLLSCTSEHEVLLPAYHCAAMRTPIEWLGARPMFYRLHPDLSADLEDIKNRIGPKTHSLIMAHFFGFPQDIRAVRDLCYAHGVYLIEDCAHAFFGRVHGEPVGSFGDYAIASTMKFFPSFDGGVLASRTRTINSIDWRNGGMRFAIKASVNMLRGLQSMDVCALSMVCCVRALQPWVGCARMAQPLLRLEEQTVGHRPQRAPLISILNGCMYGCHGHRCLPCVPLAGATSLQDGGATISGSPNVLKGCKVSA